MATSTSAKDLMKRRRWPRIAAVAGGVVIVVMIIVAIAWSRTPKVFWVNEYVDDAQPVVGYATADTLIRVIDTLLDKNGGYLTNDRTPPSVFLDNMPNWEKGVLRQARDLARVMLNDYSRSQSQSIEDEDLRLVEEMLFFEEDRWIFPSTESKFGESREAALRYRDRLTGAGSPDAQFFARADNLREWLAEVEKRLGSLSRRLGDSVANTRINEDLAGDPAAEATGSSPDNILVRTPWYEVDDIFFEARGAAWALTHFFRAAELDFAQVLEDKNARTSVRQIIRELEASLETLRSPVVLNGGGYGLFANHSLVMANYLARANAAVINLRELLDQG